jgi:hypothetical protein
MAAGYTFYYGVEEIFILDVTETVYSKCVVDGVITIPAGDDYRAKEIFNVDPVPCVQKSIYVTGPDGSREVVDAYTELVI